MDKEGLLLQYLMYDISSKNAKELHIRFLNEISKLQQILEKLEHKVEGMTPDDFQRLILQRFRMED
jgi:hypothetical protein